MVKLRVAARVIPESAYLAHLESPASTPIKGEKKFPVIIREPEEWYIGTLAREIKDKYRSLYKHDLGQVKYLKDNEDDGDLDPEDLVSEVLVDEGKAARDGSDQHVTIKIIQEQSQAIRYGSVVPDLSPVHFQPPTRPPIPRFSDVRSFLGKHSLPAEHEMDAPVNGYGNKRLRQIGVQENQDRDDLVASVERSPELTQNSQASEIRSYHFGQLRGDSVKSASHQLRRSSEDEVPATVDELEFLPSAPVDFLQDRIAGKLDRNRLQAPSKDGHRKGPTENERTYLQQSLGLSRASGTPQSETAGNDLVPKATTNSKRGQSSRSPAPQASSSISKFKQPARRDLYDHPDDADIDDSQMSSQSKNRGLPIPRLVRRTISTEEAPVPKNAQSSNENLKVSDASNLLNTGSASTEDIYGTKNSEILQHSDSDDDSGNAIYEDARMPDAEIEIPMTSDLDGEKAPRQDSVDRNELPRSLSASTNRAQQERGADPLKISAAGQDKESCTKLQSPVRNASDTGKYEREANDSIQERPDTEEPAKTKRRKKKSGISKDGESQDSQPKKTPKKAKDNSASTQEHTVSKAPKRRKTPVLDSPGEQLSQSLQESARKKGFTQAIKTTSKEKKARAMTSPSKDNEESGERLGLGITDSPRKRKKKSAAKKATPESPQMEGMKKAGKPEEGSSKKKAKMKDRLPSAAEAADNLEVQKSTGTTASAEPSSGVNTALPNWGTGPNSSLAHHEEPEEVVVSVENESGTINDVANKTRPVGLTEAEYQLMNSRAGMTQEQYEAEKKRKRAEAAKVTAELKKQSALAKSEGRRDASATSRASTSIEPEAVKAQTMSSKLKDAVSATTLRLSSPLAAPKQTRSAPSSSASEPQTPTDSAVPPNKNDESLPPVETAKAITSSSASLQPKALNPARKALSTIKTPAKASNATKTVDSSTARPSMEKNESSKKATLLKSINKLTPPITASSSLSHKSLKATNTLNGLLDSIRASNAASPAPKSGPKKPTKAAFLEETSSSGSSSDKSSDSGVAKKKAPEIKQKILDPSIRDRSVSSVDDEDDD